MSTKIYTITADASKIKSAIETYRDKIAKNMIINADTTKTLLASITVIR